MLVGIYNSIISFNQSSQVPIYIAVPSETNLFVGGGGGGVYKAVLDQIERRVGSRVILFVMYFHKIQLSEMKISLAHDHETCSKRASLFMRCRREMTS